MNSISELSVSKEKYLKKLKQKKFRKEYGYFICEGLHTFQAAMQTKDISVGEIVFDNKFAAEFDVTKLKNAQQFKNTAIYFCDEKTMRRISDDVTPPGILFTCKVLIYSDNYLDRVKSPYLIYLDHISDPGNLGTIIRTALWFGLKDIILSPESADPFNPKTVRSASGTLFGIRIISEISPARLTEFARKKHYSIISTLPRGGELVDNWMPPKKCIICLGSEAKGLDSEVRQRAHTHVSIRGSGQAESLNLAVAAGIILNRLSGLKTKNQ